MGGLARTYRIHVRNRLEPNRRHFSSPVMLLKSSYGFFTIKSKLRILGYEPRQFLDEWLILGFFLSILLVVDNLIGFLSVLGSGSLVWVAKRQ